MENWHGNRPTRRRRVIERRQWRTTTITIYARPNTRSLSHKITASHRIHLCARPNRYGWMAIINGAINWIEMERLNRQIQRLAKCENSLTFASRPCISANDDDDYEQYNELQAAVIWAYPLTDCTRKILTAGSRHAGGVKESYFAPNKDIFVGWGLIVSLIRIDHQLPVAREI